MGLRMPKRTAAWTAMTQKGAFNIHTNQLAHEQQCHDCWRSLIKARQTLAEWDSFMPDCRNILLHSTRSMQIPYACHHLVL